jgi:hypothetical protein
MGKHDHLIQEITSALENTVPTTQYVHVVKCLKRCQELLGQAAAHVEDVEFKTDLQIYAAALDYFFDDISNHPRAYVDITKGYDPVAHLQKLGIVPGESEARDPLARDLKVVLKDISKSKAKARAKKKAKGGRK